MNKIVIVGVGVAGIFTALELINNGYDGNNITMLDKGHWIDKRRCFVDSNTTCKKCKICSISNGVGGTGSFSDSKLNFDTSGRVGGDLAELLTVEEITKYLKKTYEIYQQFGIEEFQSKIYGKDHNEQALKIIEMIKDNPNMEMADCVTIHLGTDNSRIIYKRMIDFLVKNGVHIMSNAEVIDVDNIEKTWWNIALKASMTNLLANNSYSGSYVSQGTMYGASEKRIELLSKDGIDPDVVVINMGTNDLTHNISLTKFTTMYKQMIENIKQMYDDVDIFVLNMPFNKYAMSFNEPREKMNESIKTIAEEYGLFYIDLVGLIDFNGAYEYMYAGAHPNAAGMEIIGKEVGKLLSREYKRYWIGEE